MVSRAPALTLSRRPSGPFGCPRARGTCFDGLVTGVRALVVLAALPLALVVAGCGGGSSLDPGVTVVSPAQASELIAAGDVRVVDVRTPGEYASGHVEGATSMDFYAPDFGDRIAKLDPDVEYVVYCRTGHRSAQAAAMMADQGLAVDDVEGGIVAWQAAGLPLTS